MSVCRLLIDPPGDGAWNMAVDEVLLRDAAATRRATLRFYRWNAATLSLGYFQSVAQRQDHTTSLNCPIVRRLTGGGAIVHDREVTYSLATPFECDRRSDRMYLYRVVHQALIHALNLWGVHARMAAPAHWDGSSVSGKAVSDRQRPAAMALECESTQPEVGGAPAASARRTGLKPVLPLREAEVGAAPAAGAPLLCFHRRSPGDVVYQGFKILGSAQRRRRDCLLQHGSLILRTSPFAPELPGVADLAPMPLDAHQLVNAWLQNVGKALKCDLRHDALTTAQREQAGLLAEQKYRSPNWTNRR